MLRGFSNLGSKHSAVGAALLLAGFLLASSSGCALIIPDVSHEPVIHNPFPQLSRVAVAPFFNQSDEKTVDGRKFALAYFAELQATPGFEVVPLGVVEEAIIENRVDLSHPGEARRLANILGVDAVVIGSVTDYSPYYPPRCGLRVEWYAANPGFHEIPPGYGLPWGTAQEEFIPAPLVFESEFALAKAQLATQTPDCGPQPTAPPPLPQVEEPGLFPGSPATPLNGKGLGPANQENSGLPNPLVPSNVPPPSEKAKNKEASPKPSANSKDQRDRGSVVRVKHEEAGKVEELPAGASTAAGAAPPAQSEAVASAGTIDATAAPLALPPNWPDERGFIPPPPSPVRPACCPTNGPVMTHTRIYHGNDGDFTEALASYYHFRDDARFGGWQNYLSRSDDFIRFCCHMHIAEMLSARGGASETRVVWRWSDCR